MDGGSSSFSPSPAAPAEAAAPAKRQQQQQQQQQAAPASAVSPTGPSGSGYPSYPSGGSGSFSSNRFSGGRTAGGGGPPNGQRSHQPTSPQPSGRFSCLVDRPSPLSDNQRGHPAAEGEGRGGGAGGPSGAAGYSYDGVHGNNSSSGGMGGAPRSGGGRPPRPSQTGTGWDVRDGRVYRPEKEEEVFSSDKQQSTGIKFDAYDKVPVELKGRGSERILAVESFLEVGCKFSPLLMENVARVNYNRPTPIQKNSIPTILSGRDLMACAQTGSGKTAAFLYPIIAQMLQVGPPPLPAGERAATCSYRRSVYPVCLVLSPTRELAMQIYQEARKFQFGTGIRTVPVYGGSQIKRQLVDLDSGCDICVATPGRLADVLERRKIRLALVRYLVLDEADRMLDMGFLPQIKSIVDDFDLPPCPPPGARAEEGPPQGRQTIMFSATFPKEIQMLAKDFMHDYIYLAVGRVGSTNEFIRQRLLYADEDQKIKLLVNLLREGEKGLVIVFVETKKKADMIEDYLLQEAFPAISIHGDRTQEEREDALRHFKSGHRPILVATDVAARGLDISNVKHVINYDLPSNIDDYVHRIGRTGRAGNLGLATSFVNEMNRPILRDLLNLLEEANQEVPSFLHPLVVSCTASSMRLGGRGGFGRMGSGAGGGRFGGGASLGSRNAGGASGSYSIGSGGGRMGGASDWRSDGMVAGTNRPAAGFAAALNSLHASAAAAAAAAARAAAAAAAAAARGGEAPVERLLLRPRYLSSGGTPLGAPLLQGGPPGGPSSSGGPLPPGAPQRGAPSPAAKGGPLLPSAISAQTGTQTPQQQLNLLQEHALQQQQQQEPQQQQQLLLLLKQQPQQQQMLQRTPHASCERRKEENTNKKDGGGQGGPLGVCLVFFAEKEDVNRV
ncbi:hypothetical protein Emed_001340 [Eimeria media]